MLSYLEKVKTGREGGEEPKPGSRKEVEDERKGRKRRKVAPKCVLTRREGEGELARRPQCALEVRMGVGRWRQGASWPQARAGRERSR